MNVLFIARKFEEGEASTEYIKHLSHEVVERGHNAAVVSFDDGSYYSIDDRVEVHRVNLNFDGDNLYNWSMMLNNELKRQAREVFDEEEIDLVHIIDWTTISGGVALSKHLDVPLFITFQSTENTRGFGGEHAGMISELEWQGVDQAEKIIATSEDTKNSLLFDLDAEEEKLDYIDPYEEGWTSRVINAYEKMSREEVVQ